MQKNFTLPANWRLTSWGNCGKFIAGTGFPKNQQGFTNYEIPFYKVGSLKFSDSNGYIYDNSNTINEDIRQTLKAPLIPPNSVLFAKIGEAIRLNRRSLNSVPCCIDNNLVAFVSDSIFFKYAYYWSQTINLYDYARATTVPAIRKSDLENIEIPVPPLAEQKRIVAVLDALFEKIDAAKSIVQKISDGCELRRAAILHRAFTGELSAKWRVENNLTLQDWQQKTLGEILSLSKEKTETFDANLKYVGLENIEKGGGEISFQSADAVKSTKNIFYKGDLLYGKLRPYLNKHGIANFDGVCSTDILVFNSNELSFNNFVNYFFNLPSFIEYAVANSKGINLPRVSAKEILNAPIKLPPLAEQKEIARLLDNLLAKENCVKEISEKTLQQIDALKKNILARAFRGELGTNNLEN